MTIKNFTDFIYKDIKQGFDENKVLFTGIIPIVSIVIGTVYQYHKISPNHLRTFDYLQVISDGAFILTSLLLFLFVAWFAVEIIKGIPSFLLQVIKFFKKLFIQIKLLFCKGFTFKKLDWNGASIYLFLFYLIFSGLIIYGVFHMLDKSMYYYFTHLGKQYISDYSTTKYIYAYEIENIDCGKFTGGNDINLVGKGLFKNVKSDNNSIIISVETIKELFLMPEACKNNI